ncbi:MAG: OmpA family protein [Deltaproteobacteria bacterium]|nr:OmpA family protein [Deltaproteobacteria bacterium]
MTRCTWRRIGGVAALTLAIALDGCAARPTRGGFNCDRRWGGGTIGGALTGAAIGGGVGGGIVATSGETERQAEDYATAIGIGAISGALIGGFFGHCAFDPPHEEEPPPPPPAPPPPPPVVKKKIVLRGVNFDFDKATIRADAAAILEEAARILRDEPDVRVSVGGHTDARGTDAYNDRLSERRADSVVDRLTRLGVSASRLEARGFGESRPVATNDTEEGRAQNRRVELNVR